MGKVYNFNSPSPKPASLAGNIWEKLKFKAEVSKGLKNLKVCLKNVF